MSHNEIIAVVTAAAGGAKIEFRDCLDASGPWFETAIPDWNFHRFDYRVRPEPPKPREWWIAAYRTNRMAHVFRSEHDAQSLCYITELAEPFIHVREVL